MDLVHDSGSMDPIHILMNPVHGPGPRRGSMDRGSMFCTFPTQQNSKLTVLSFWYSQGRNQIQLLFQMIVQMIFQMFFFKTNGSLQA